VVLSEEDVVAPPSLWFVVLVVLLLVLVVCRGGIDDLTVPELLPVGLVEGLVALLDDAPALLLFVGDDDFFLPVNAKRLIRISSKRDRLLD